MLRFSVLALSLIFSQFSLADFQANVGVGSEYLKDGIGQSRSQPVLQSGLTYHNQLGLYGGLWASTIDHGDNSANAEWSGFGGFYFPISERFAVDLGMTYYDYLGDRKASEKAYDEGFLRLLINDAWTFGIRQSEDYLGAGEPKRALESAYTLQTESFAFEFYLAQQRYLKVTDTVNFGGVGNDDYWHFRFAVGRSYDNWDYRVKLERTTLNSRFDAGTNITFSVHRYFDF